VAGAQIPGDYILIHVTLPAPRIFKWFLDYGKFMDPWDNLNNTSTTVYMVCDLLTYNEFSF
jgi:hypothetical protein